MAKIIGNTTATPNPRPDWNQTDETKADYIKNKPAISKGENGGVVVSGSFSAEEAEGMGGITIAGSKAQLHAYSGVDIGAFHPVNVSSQENINLTAPTITISSDEDELSSYGCIIFSKDAGIDLSSLYGIDLSTAGSIDLSPVAGVYIDGSLTVSGNLTVAGDSIESSLENVVTPQNTITLRDGTTTSLLSGEYTGLIAENYDGTNTGMLVFDKDGTAYVGDEGDLQPLATRNLNNDNKVVKWDKDNSTLTEGNITIQDNGSIVINEGEAAGDYSIAGGSTDKTVIEDLLGSLASTQVTIEKSKANASNAISIGSGNVVNSVAGNAIGVWNTAGCKGYYWKELTNTAGAETSTFALSAKQPALLGSWEAVASVDWQVGDTICVIDESHFPMCATITAIGTKEIGNILTGKKTTVTITTTKLPFDGEESLVLTTPQNKSICAFYQKTEVSVLNQLENKRWYPREGAVELGWIATSTGVENLVTGTAAFATGWNNWQSSSFGIVAGRENESGYSDLTAGVANENVGESSVVAGKSNKNKVKSVGNVVAGHSNDNTGHNSLVVGARNVVKPGQYASDLEGDHVVAGADNEVTGWNNIVAGHHNDVDSSNSLVVGEYGKAGSATAIAVGNGISDYNGSTLYQNSFEVSKGGDVNASSITAKNKVSAKSVEATELKIDSISSNSITIDKYTTISSNGIKLVSYIPVNEGSPDEYDHTSQIFSVTPVDNGYNPELEGQLKMKSFEVSSLNNKLSIGDTLSVNGYNTIVTGARNDVGTSYINEAGDTVTVSIGGDHIVGGADNKVAGGWNNIVSGSKNTNISGGDNIVAGSNNTNKGARSVVSGENNIANANRSIVAGQSSEVEGSNNIVVGNDLTTTSRTYNSVVSGARNTVVTTDADGGDHLIVGADNKVSGWNNIVGGSNNTVDAAVNNSLVAGQANKVNHANTLVVGKGNYTTRDSQAVIGEGNYPAEDALLSVGGMYYGYITDEQGWANKTALEAFLTEDGTAGIRVGQVELTELQMYSLSNQVKSADTNGWGLEEIGRCTGRFNNCDSTAGEGEEVFPLIAQASFVKVQGDSCDKIMCVYHGIENASGTDIAYYWQATSMPFNRRCYIPTSDLTESLGGFTYIFYR